MGETSKVLFVCSKNSGKSQMAEALAAHQGAGRLEVYSGGTKPGTDINEQATEAIAEIGADMSAGRPKPIDDDILASVDRVIILGEDAQVELPEGAKAKLERWVTAEPLDQGIEGMERMRMIRDEIGSRVENLIDELGV